ncbi:uncharacterized protein BDV17DRAFT_276096 [Aspergillus undulatus]|uniref:uncharacterized protein n=1 Tax=Aspergillus undulatus TaxID=1810928 RepID=UPI003CCCA869
MVSTSCYGLSQYWNIPTLSRVKTKDNFLVTPTIFLPNGELCPWIIEGRWITYSGRRVLYLPQDRQVESCDVMGNSLVIGSVSGIITTLKFKDMNRYFVQREE